MTTAQSNSALDVPRADHVYERALSELMSEDLSEYLEQDIVGLILQYLHEKNYTEAAHKLEKEAQYYFDIEHFRQLWIDGDWDNLVSYLAGFVKSDQNSDHNLLYFEIIKQKFLDALDRGDKTVASNILKNEIRTFLSLSEGDMDPESRRVQIYNEFASLLTFDDFRKHKNLTWVENARETRKSIFPNIEAYLMEKVPLIAARCEYPDVPQKGRLRTIINQSLNWQMSLLPPDPSTQPRIQTLFVDYTATPSNEPVNCGNYAFMTKRRSQLPPALRDAPLTSNTYEQSEDEGSDSEEKQNSAQKRPRSNSTNQRKPKRQKISRGSESRPGYDDDADVDYEVPTEIAFVLPVIDDLIPTQVAFHPKDESLLLVSTRQGALLLWDILKKEVRARQLVTDLVSKIYWSPCGRYFALIYERLIALPVYELKAKESNEPTNAPRLILPLRVAQDHTKRVTAVHWALLPTHLNAETERTVLISGSEDGTIRAYDVGDGQALRWSFEGHSGPITSLSVIHYRNVPLLISTSLDGSLRAWLFPDPDKSQTPGLAMVEEAALVQMKQVQSMVCTEGRLFSCGLDENSLVEWNYVHGKELRRYPNYNFDSCVSLYVSTRFRILAANNANKIKFWHLNRGVPRADLTVNGKSASFDLNATSGILATVVETVSGGCEIQIYANSNNLALWPPHARISIPKSRPPSTVPGVVGGTTSIGHVVGSHVVGGGVSPHDIKIDPSGLRKPAATPSFAPGAALSSSGKKMPTAMSMSVEVTPINVPTPSAIPVHGAGPIPGILPPGAPPAQPQGIPSGYGKSPATGGAPAPIPGPSTWPPGLPFVTRPVIPGMAGGVPLASLGPGIPNTLLASLQMAPTMTVPTLTPTPTAPMPGVAPHMATQSVSVGIPVAAVNPAGPTQTTTTATTATSNVASVPSTTTNTFNQQQTQLSSSQQHQTPPIQQQVQSTQSQHQTPPLQQPQSQPQQQVLSQTTPQGAPEGSQ